MAILILMELVLLVKANAAADFGLAAVLPQGRYQGALRFGTISNIQDKYSNAGILQTPSRMNQRLNNERLQKISPDFKKLVNRLNSQFPKDRPGDRVDPGELEVKGKASVNYIAPQLARGITQRWTLGLAVPIVNFQSNVHFANGGTNHASEVLKYTGDVGRALSKEDAQNLKNLKNGPKALVEHQAHKTDYKTVSNRDENFMGDVMLGSSYMLYNSRYWSFYLLNMLELPTGPKDDPDDLVDLTIFGKTALSTTLYTNLDLNYRWHFGFGVGYNWGVPDRIEKRVPKNEGDSLPDASSKENVKRDPGDTVVFQLASIYKFTDYLDAGLGYELGYKGRDRYSGSRDRRYDLLEKDTGQQYNMMKLKLSYTTVTNYLNGKSKIPYSLTYAFADIVGGVNIERQTTHELLLAVYF